MKSDHALDTLLVDCLLQVSPTVTLWFSCSVSVQMPKKDDTRLLALP